MTLLLQLHGQFVTMVGKGPVGREVLQCSNTADPAWDQEGNGGGVVGAEGFEPPTLSV